MILEAFPETKVDVHHPEVMLHVEVRNRINIYSIVLPGPGGMPVGTNGKAMLLLSGGIDSPVAGYMISKRGVKIDAVYFHAPPYTSERAKQKVVDLAKLRRYMMRIDERLAVDAGAQALITGESIGQVASQTMQSLAATDASCTMPVFRPVIGFDKQEIVDVAEKIGTYETSVLPFEDCCTIFVAKHPVTKPNLKMIERSEEKLKEKIDEMVETAINTVEKVWC